MENCGVSLDNLEFLSELMIKQYNLNVEATLTSEETEKLDNFVDILSDVSNKYEIELNAEGFKKLAKKLYPKSSGQFGGVGEGELVPFRDNQIGENAQPQQRANRFNKLDFYAILMFLGAILLCYIAYVKLNEISFRTIGMETDDIVSILSDDFKNAINNVKNMPTNDLTFVQFVYKSITTFSCSMGNSQLSNFQKLVIDTIRSAVTNAEQQIRQTAVES
jgi:hypothetical protein